MTAAGDAEQALARLATARLALVPLRPSDAEELVGILADPVLYAFTGDAPPSLEELRARLERQAAGHSADGGQEWRNWIVRLGPVGPAIGFVQATISAAGSAADVAWLIGISWQGRGFATEAAQELVAWLEERGVLVITAHIHPQHAASAAVAVRAGLEPTTDVVDGERVWRRMTRRGRRGSKS